MGCPCPLDVVGAIPGFPEALRPGLRASVTPGGPGYNPALLCRGKLVTPATFWARADRNGGQMCTLYRTEYPGGLGMSVVGWRLRLHPGSYTACVPSGHWHIFGTPERPVAGAGGGTSVPSSVLPQPVMPHICSRGGLLRALMGDSQAGHPTWVAAFDEDSRVSSCLGWRLGSWTVCGVG